MTSLTALVRSVLLRPVSLRHRALNASIWSLADVSTNNVLRLLSNLILTRLLVPEAFGAMAIVSTVQSGLVLISDLSIHRSIVQSRSGDTPEFLRVSWTVQAMRGCLLMGLVVLAGGILWLLAPFIAAPGTIYADPALPALVAVSSLSMLFAGLESTNTWLAVRKMHLGRIAVLNALAQIATIVATLLFTRFSATAWAMVWGGVAAGAFRTILTHRILAGPRMRFHWDKGIANELWQMGRWLILSSVFTFASMNADRLILGGLLRAETFGYYTVASVWVQAVATLLLRFTDPIAHSAFSEVRRVDPNRGPGIYVRFRGANDAIRGIVFALILLLGPAIIGFLYPDRYVVAAAFVPLLGLALLAARFELLRMYILSCGDARTTVHSAAAQAVAVVLGVPLGFIAFGVGGAVAASALSSLASAPLLVARARPFLSRRLLISDVFAIVVVAFVSIVTYFQLGVLSMV